MTPAAPDGAPDVAYGNSIQSVGIAMEQAIEQKYNLAVPPIDPAAPTAPPATGVSTIFLVCRAVKGPNDSSANSDLVYAILDGLKASPIVEPKGTQMGERLITDDSPYTFTFAVKVALKTPLKF